MGHPIQHHQHGKCSHVIFSRTFTNVFCLHIFFLSEGEQIIIPRTLTSEVLAAIQSVRFIAQHIKDSDRDNEVSRLQNDLRKEMSIHAKSYDNFYSLMDVGGSNVHLKFN